MKTDTLILVALGLAGAYVVWQYSQGQSGQTSTLGSGGGGGYSDYGGGSSAGSGAGTGVGSTNNFTGQNTQDEAQSKSQSNRTQSAGYGGYQSGSQAEAMYAIGSALSSVTASKEKENTSSWIVKPSSSSSGSNELFPGVPIETQANILSQAGAYAVKSSQNNSYGLFVDITSPEQARALSGIAAGSSNSSGSSSSSSSSNKTSSSTKASSSTSAAQSVASNYNKTSEAERVAVSSSGKLVANEKMYSSNPSIAAEQKKTMTQVLSVLNKNLGVSA